MKITLAGEVVSIEYKNHRGLVHRVEPESLGEHLRISPGDTIVSINGHNLRDEILSVPLFFRKY